MLQMYFKNRFVLIFLGALSGLILVLLLRRGNANITQFQDYLSQLSKQFSKCELPNLGQTPIEPYRISSYSQFRRVFMEYDNEACKSKESWGGHTVYQETYKGKYNTLDGNYTICLDEKIKPSSDCIVYSFGINNDWSFDEKAEAYGCSVFSYDPSMNKEPHMHSTKVKFVNYGIGPEDTDGGPNNWKLRRFSTLLKENDHQHSIIDILKIDVEQAEHDSIVDIVRSGAIRNIKQLVIETHNTIRGDLSLDKYYSTYWQILNQGFVKFFVEEWPGGCSKKNEKGEIEVHCYIFSFYNQRFLYKENDM